MPRGRRYVPWSGPQLDPNRTLYVQPGTQPRDTGTYNPPKGSIVGTNWRRVQDRTIAS